MKRFHPYILMLFILSACASEKNIATTNTTTQQLQLQCNDCNTAAIRTEIMASTEDFPNPERGLYQETRIGPNTVVSQEISDEYLNDLSQQNISMLHVYFNLEDFKHREINQDFLEKISQTFQAARRHGLKVIPRFTYNFPNEQNFELSQDASPKQIQQHLDQLTPLLQHNNDVIAFMEAGFVGAWGEWHHSSNQLVVEDENGKTLRPDAIEVLKKILTALPKNRMLAVRYPQIREEAFGKTPLNERNAYNTTDETRIGAHNDCFLASASDRGTYSEDETVRSSERELLIQNNHYAPQSGETCSNDERAQPFTACNYAVSELQRLHFSALHIGFEANVLARWKREGCFEEISKRLGYRFALNWVRTPEWLNQNEPMILELDFSNLGFAAPYNQHPMELVLANNVRSLHIPLYTDVRRWLPGQPHHVYRFLDLPNDLEPGEYQMGLSMPDTDPALAKRPEYAIRLANQLEWRNGINWLGRTIKLFK